MTFNNKAKSIDFDIEGILKAFADVVLDKYDDDCDEECGCCGKSKVAFGDPDVTRSLERLLDALDDSIAALEKAREKEKLPELEKCPICGCTCHTEKDDDGLWGISCGYCPLETEAIFESEEEAIDYWNDRECAR